MTLSFHQIVAHLGLELSQTVGCRVEHALTKDGDVGGQRRGNQAVLRLVADKVRMTVEHEVEQTLQRTILTEIVVAVVGVAGIEVGPTVFQAVGTLLTE